jgi:TonB family protein
MRVSLVVTTVLAVGAAASAQPTPSAEVLRLGPGIRPPAVLFHVDPEYSDEAFYAKRQGVVVVSLVVQKDGTPNDLSVAHSLGFGLDEKAIAAVKQWRFRPGEKERLPVSVLVTVEVNFLLPRWRFDSALCKKSGAGSGIAPRKAVFPPSLTTPQPVFVDLSYQVDESGVPQNILVNGSPDAALGAPAMAAVSQWRFEPLIQSGQAVSFACTTKLHYR